MKKYYRHIIYVMIMTFFLCLIIASKKKPKQMVYDFDGVDSLCVADSIPRDLNTWEGMDYYDERTDKVKTKYYLNVGDSIYYIVYFNDNYDFVVEKQKE